MKSEFLLLSTTKGISCIAPLRKIHPENAMIRVMLFSEFLNWQFSSLFKNVRIKVKSPLQTFEMDGKKIFMFKTWLFSNCRVI